jgi:crotonobetainyl-CoA:carnitine CoA-transferase CaiB-like acyl-CoA transferase
MTVGESPLQGITVVERSGTVAGAYTGRLLAVLGAETIMVEPPDGHPLRRVPPLLPGPGPGSAFAYLAAGKASVVCDVHAERGRREVRALLAVADVYVDDHDAAARGAAGLTPDIVTTAFPHLVYTSVRPFGAHGPKSDWVGREINLFHASGEGSLLPNGLAAEVHPDRPPLKAAGYFAELQGGLAGALGALSALWSGAGTVVDASVQDAAVAVGAFTIQRFGDGAHETRQSRSFAYGGVLECADGYIEILTLEDRQWSALLGLVGRPDWSADETLKDSAGRSRRGSEINSYLRDWASTRRADEVVDQAQQLGVPAAKYSSPAEIVHGDQETARELFQPVHVPGTGTLPMLRAPFRLGAAPLSLSRGVPELGADQWRVPAAGAGRDLTAETSR